MEIELIERPDQPACIARVFDESFPTAELLFVSATRETREQAIAEAQTWARSTFGHELPVSLFVERFEKQWPYQNRS